MLKAQDVIKKFFKDRKKLSKESRRSYSITFNQFFTAYPLDFNEVKASHIRKWQSKLEDQGLKPRSIRVKTAAMKTLYKYAKEENLITKNPTDGIENPLVAESPPVYLDKDMLARLRELCKDDVRERAFVETLYVTGVRISELLNIHIEDINKDHRQIWIRKGKGNKERYVFFTSECLLRIQEYLKSRKVESPYLFCNNSGNPLSTSWAQKKFQGYTIALKSKSKITPHILRHTLAAHLAEKNMSQENIQEILGHKNFNSTQIYTKLYKEARKKIYDSFRI